MARLSDMHQSGREHLEALECASFDDKPFVAPIPLSERTVALISSAGLIRRGDAPFKGGDSGYRSFPDSLPDNEILLSHISVNFDRVAAIKNIQTIFPRTLLKEMVSEKEVGASSSTHYSFMGATDPLLMEEEAKAVARELKSQNVDTAVLLPV